MHSVGHASISMFLMTCNNAVLVQSFAVHALNKPSEQFIQFSEDHVLNSGNRIHASTLHTIACAVMCLKLHL